MKTGRYTAFSPRSLLVSCLIATSWLQSSVVAECEKDEDCPTYQFRSRPDIHAPILDMEILRPELTTPGYIFMAPYRNRDPGPYIYDNFGNLVWSSSAQSGPKTAHNPHVCRYKGEDHMCFFQGQQHQGFARGHGTIMNRHYQVVKQVETSGAMSCSDMHEFRLAPYSDGRSALMTVYHTRPFDLTANPHFLIKEGMGWVVDGVFQEIDVETGALIFEWRSLDHLDPSLSYTYPGTTDTSGTGLKEWSPWDYLHLNSIDKNAEGDYLISARHMRAIYKISGKDGHVMWELGGKNPSFNQTNFEFGYQHHATWLSENATHTILSFFDNGFNGFTHVSDRSTGHVIVINHLTGEATSISNIGCPTHEGVKVGSQGSMQVLESGNVHMGWGEWPWFSEHTADGSPVQFAKMPTGRIRDYMHYRSGKFNWTGLPIVNPALWTYARDTNATNTTMVMYSSWNGATEVVSWNYYVADHADGPFTLSGSTGKDGFETVYHTDKISTWAYAEALGSDGQVLGRSEIAKTFIPSESLRPFCNEYFCDGAHSDKSKKHQKEVEELPGPTADMLSSNRGFNTSRYYAETTTIYSIVNDGMNEYLNWRSEIDMTSMVLGIALTVMTATLVIVIQVLSRRVVSRGVTDRWTRRISDAWNDFKFRRDSVTYKVLDEHEIWDSRTAHPSPKDMH